MFKKMLLALLICFIATAQLVAAPSDMGERDSLNYIRLSDRVTINYVTANATAGPQTMVFDVTPVRIVVNSPSSDVVLLPNNGVDYDTTVGDLIPMNTRTELTYRPATILVQATSPVDVTVNFIVTY